MDISSITSLYSDVYTTAANQSATELQDKLSSDYTSATDDELMDVCKQFEAYFLEQVFKEMEKTIPEDEDSDSSTSQLVDYFKDEMLQEIASESTEQSSLGLAQMLYEQMQRNLGTDITQISEAAIETTAAEAAIEEL
ncbi:MAG: rod-binding protein [Lachnospiraceae bacterium]|nr:rod-binding protein [Lachnospiraceae bacterium]